jgi:hypothetical protein
MYNHITYAQIRMLGLRPPPFKSIDSVKKTLDKTYNHILIYSYN